MKINYIKEANLLRVIGYAAFPSSFQCGPRTNAIFAFWQTYEFGKILVIIQELGRELGEETGWQVRNRTESGLTTKPPRSYLTL